MSDIQGAKYVGTRYPLCDPQGRRIEMHVVSVDHPNGPWEAIYCRTKGQAEAIEEMVIELTEIYTLNERLGDLLTQTANALHGGPLENGMWSFHDLPELATELRTKLELAKTEVKAILDMIPNAVHVREGGGDEDIFASLSVSVANLQRGGKA